MAAEPPTKRFKPRRTEGSLGPPGYLDSGIVQLKPKEFVNPSVPRGTTWARLQSPTHPDFAPYVRKELVTPDGRQYMVYPEDHDGPLSEGFDKSLLRFGEGQRFQKAHSRFPCPEGWLESTDRSYCERFGDPKKTIRTIYNGPPQADHSGLYSDHAYIPREQHFANPEPPVRTNYSDSTFMRSHDFRSGGYSVFYPPHSDPNVTTYMPLSEWTSKKRYDPSWNLPPQETPQKLARLRVSDMYL